MDSTEVSHSALTLQEWNQKHTITSFRFSVASTFSNVKERKPKINLCVVVRCASLNVASH